MKKIKVLHKIYSGLGGIEKYIFENMEYINRDKFEFDVLTVNKDIVNTDYYKKLKFGVKKFSIEGRYDKKLFNEEISEILDEGYDVFHIHTSSWTGFSLEEIAINKKIPKIIVHSHSNNMECIKTEIAKEKLEKHNYYKQQFNESLATNFCACSKEAAEWLFGPQIRADKIQILKNAIDVDKFKFNKIIRNKMRKKLNLEGCYVLGHVGRMAEVKNHKFIIETFYELYKTNNKARLLLIGSGELEESLKELVKKYNLEAVVYFEGWQTQVNEYLQAMDIFLFPSLFEGFGTALLEAQTSDLKCIANESITKEIGITNNIEFVKLNKELWVSKICNNMTIEYERKDISNIITEKGFNIKYTVKELEKLYSS